MRHGKGQASGSELGQGWKDESFSFTQWSRGKKLVFKCWLWKCKSWQKTLLSFTLSKSLLHLGDNWVSSCKSLLQVPPPIRHLLQPSGRLFALTKISQVWTNLAKCSMNEIQLCTWHEISLRKHCIFSSMSTIVCALWLTDIWSSLPSADLISKRGSGKLRRHASVYPPDICFHNVCMWGLWFITAPFKIALTKKDSLTEKKRNTVYSCRHI